MNLVIRVFPKQKRTSFSSQNVSFDGDQITVKKLLQHLNLSTDEYKACRGIDFLSLDSLLLPNETINIIPI